MAENSNGKFRHRKVKFAQISNAALQDKRLSLKAKGLYALIQCYITMENYDLYKWFLLKQCKEGEKAFNTAWKELKDTGYLKQYRIPSGKNDTFEYEYELLDEADESMPALINLNKRGEVVSSKVKEQSEPPNCENPHTPQKGVYANSHTPHFAPCANGTQCQRGVIDVILSLVILS